MGHPQGRYLSGFSSSFLLNIADFPFSLRILKLQIFSLISISVVSIGNFLFMMSRASSKTFLILIRFPSKRPTIDAVISKMIRFFTFPREFRMLERFPMVILIWLHPSDDPFKTSVSSTGNIFLRRIKNFATSISEEIANGFVPVSTLFIRTSENSSRFNFVTGYL